MYQSILKLNSICKLFADMYLLHKKLINWFMRMTNGNGKLLKILYQNIPCKIKAVQKIEEILYKENPDILGVAEPDHNHIDINWSGYKLIKGSIFFRP